MKKVIYFLLITCLLIGSWPGVAIAADLETTPTPSPTSTARDGSKNGTTYAPSEDVLQLEVPDCPGVSRDIDASKLPPSIYPKPTCSGAGYNSNTQMGTALGTYGTGTTAPAAGTVFWFITGGKVYDIFQGYGMTDWVNEHPEFTAKDGDYAYCADLGTPGHCGVDITIPNGKTVYAPWAGKVVCGGTGVPLDAKAEPCQDFDSTTISTEPHGRLQIELANGDMVILGFLQKITVKPGDTVTAQQAVGTAGSESTGDHIHVEYRHKDGDHWTTYDPRDKFDVLPTGTPSPTPTATSAKADESKVAAATTSLRMDELMTKYGFYSPQGQSNRNFSDYLVNFGIARDLAIKYAPTFNIDPEMIVWWIWSETATPYDSYGYQNCDDLHPGIPIDQSCNKITSGDWQVGYGQQYSVGLVGDNLANAFKATHGDPNDAAAVQQVGQNVITKSGVTKTFPLLNISNLLSNEPANRYWIFALQRDPAISTYLLAQVLGGEALPGPNGSTYHDKVMGWGGYTEADWQAYSDIMNDVVVNWGVAPSTNSTNCVSATTSANGSCSTQSDQLNGLTVEEFVKRVNANMQAYKNIAECAEAPWQMIAAINFRETSLQSSYTGVGQGGALGPWQIDPSNSLYNNVDPNDFEATGCIITRAIIKNAGQNGPVATALNKHLSQSADPANHDDEMLIKDAFFAYNGRGGWQGNVVKGCTANTDGHSDWNFDCSSYVMNNMDANHLNMCIGTANEGDFCPASDGAWKVFYKLYYSTYGSDGKLLVYGGLCNFATGVVNGIALPTKSNVVITSHFFEPYGFGDHSPHIGIDIGNKEGDPVFSMTDGKIVSSDWSDMGGYYIIIHVPAGTADNTDERWVYYGHLAADGRLSAGSTVKAGQQIATTGSVQVLHNGVLTVNGEGITGAHLHFDIRITQAEADDASGHVNPCSIGQFVQGYPSLKCDAWGTSGVKWN